MLSSFDIRFNQSMAAMRDFFKKDVVTRQEVMDYVASGATVPTKFWTTCAIARGVYKIADIVEGAVQEPALVVEHRQEMVANPSSPDAGKVTHFESAEAFIPTVNPNFVQWGNFDTVKKMVASNRFFTLFLTGETGTGKNEMIEQVCSQLNRPLVQIDITADTTEEHLVGSKTLVDGNVKYEEGPLIWAAETGAILCLNELTLGSSQDLMCLQSVLDGKPFFVKSLNRIVTPIPGFAVVATDNTKGRGNSSGRYIGTNIQNTAFLERFGVYLEQGYAPAKVESKILSKFLSSLKTITEEDEKFVEQLVKWVNVTRKTYENDAIDEQITTRRAKHIVNNYAVFGDAVTAITYAVNRFETSTKNAMLIIWDKLSVEQNIVEPETTEGNENAST